MQKRRGVMPTAVEPGPESPALLSGSSGARTEADPLARETITSFQREAGSLESQKPTITLMRSPFSHSSQCPDLPHGVLGFIRLVLWEKRLPHRPCVPRGTRQRLGLKAERRGYRLSVEDPLGPAGFAASGSRPTRVSPAAPACELSQQSCSLVEVKALARRRHHRSLSGIRGGARETHVAQPEDAGAPCGQAQRGVHSIHRARARSQDLSGSLISRKPGSRLPVDISGSARPGGSAAIGCRVEVNALTRRCLSRSSA